MLDAREVGHHELELERVEVAGGIGGDPAVVERPQHDEDRVAVAQRAEHLGAQALAGLRAGRQREVHELEPGRTDLLRLRHRRERSRRSSGTVAIPTAASYSLGRREPVSALNRRFAPGTR